MATLRNQFDNEDKLLDTAINKKNYRGEIPTLQADQQNICEKHLAAMNKLFTDATGLYPSPTLSGPDSLFPVIKPINIYIAPPTDDDIAIESAPANNTTQEIQFMNQGQQGSTNIPETPPPPPPPPPIISPPIL